MGGVGGEGFGERAQGHPVNVNDRPMVELHPRQSKKKQQHIGAHTTTLCNLPEGNLIDHSQYAKQTPTQHTHISH